MTRALASAMARLVAASRPPLIPVRTVSATSPTDNPRLHLASRLPLPADLPILSRTYSSSSGDNTSTDDSTAATTTSLDLAAPRRTAIARNNPPPGSIRNRNASTPTGTISDLVHKSRLYNLSIYRSLYPMRSTQRRKIKRIHLPTHYVEVSYKLRKAVVFYQPSIAHIPHGIKERNPVLVTSGAKRGQNT